MTEPTGATGAPTPPTDPAPPTAPPEPPTGTPADPGQEPTTPPADPPGDDPRITRANREAQKYRQQAREAQAAQQAQLDTIAKALGLKPDDVDPAALTEQLTTAQAAARESATQLAVYRAAPALGADPDALLDSASTLRALADIDPADADAVAAAITTALESNPRLKAADPQPPAGRSSAPAGGPPQPAQLSRADLKRMTPEEIVTARREGRLASLLGG